MTTTTPDPIHEQSTSPERIDSMIVMLVAHGWEESQPHFAVPEGEISIRFFRKGCYGANIRIAGTALAVLLVYQMDAKGGMRRPARYTLRELSDLNAYLTAISRGVAP